MTHTPHQLAEEFPEHLVKMRHLKETDGHFHRISKEYDEVNHRIHLGEANIDPCDDFHMSDLRKRRLALKDEINGMLTRAEPLAEQEEA